MTRTGPPDGAPDEQADGGTASPPDRSAGGRFERVMRADAIAPGQVLPASVAGVAMVVYRDGDRCYAAQRHCLHHRADLAQGAVEGGFLVCPLHGWRYRADTGRHEASPETCLRTYAVRISDGYVEIDPSPRWLGEVMDHD